MYPVMSRCPVCGAEMEVTRLYCRTCASALEGHFKLGKFYHLDRDQLQFVDTFIKCRGSIKDTGMELGISYPTVVNRLNEVLIRLGYRDRVKAPEPPILSPDRRRQILDDLAHGVINANEASRLLRSR